MANPNFAPTLSTDEIYRGTNTTICLSDDLDAIEESIDSINEGLVNYAAVNHTHEPSTIGAALATHSHYYEDIVEMNTALAAKADVDHTHSGYAASEHSHSGYASSDHTHSGYASSSHTHSGYADASHEHDEYFSVDGGTINGDTNVAGVLRVQGQQVIYYNASTNSQTIGTNNATGGTTICCGPSATAAINGTYLKTATILPRTTGTYTCGNANFRWSGIYSTAAVNVSSDERLKRDIKPVDEEALVNFVDGLNVCSYNYKSDAEDAPARIGLIAQDLIRIDPEIAKFFVSEDEDGMLGIKPADLVFPLLLAVQKLSARVTELEKANK